MSQPPRAPGTYPRVLYAGGALLVIVQLVSLVAWLQQPRRALHPVLSTTVILVAVADLGALALGVLALRALRGAGTILAQATQETDAVRLRGDLLEIVLAASRGLWLEQSQERLLGTVAETARGLVGASSATVYLPDDEHAGMLRQVAVVPEHAPLHGPPALPASAARGVRKEEEGTQHRLSVPVEAEGGKLGGLLRLDGVTVAPLPDHERALTLLATQAAIALRNAQLHERAAAQASEDGLTALLNHRAFQTRLEGEVVRARRGGHPLSVMMVDLDDFGAVNNTYGHQIGDTTLIAAAETMRDILRTTDVVARYGGDEFGLILPETDVDEAVAVAERMCAAIAARAVVARGVTVSISASIGVASLPLHGQTREELIRAADQATYAAKRTGKGRVCRPEEASPTFDRNPVVLATKLESANMAAVEALAVAVDAKDAYTRGHSQRVSAYAEALARAMKLPAADVTRVRVAGLLHDVGKIGVPDAILTKLGPLDDEEFAVLEQHPVVGERMLSAVPFLRNIAPAIRHHHERWDGQGYPDGLAGEAIPLDAAIIMVADSFDAMTSSRTYRPALTLAEARRRVGEGSGTQFSPRVVEAFVRAVGDGSLKALSPGGTLPLRSDFNARASARLRQHRLPPASTGRVGHKDGS